MVADLGDSEHDAGSPRTVAQKKTLTPAVTLSDVNRDGRTDLVAEFEESALLASGDLAVGSATVVLLGRFRNGKHLRGAGLVQAN